MYMLRMHEKTCSVSGTHARGRLLAITSSVKRAAQDGRLQSAGGIVTIGPHSLAHDTWALQERLMTDGVQQGTSVRSQPQVECAISQDGACKRHGQSTAHATYVMYMQ